MSEQRRFYGSEMREMLRAMQSGEMTVSRGVELVDMWLGGNYSDEQLPPVRNELGEDEMPWDRIDALTKQRDKLREIVGALRWPIHADDRKAAQATGKHPAPCARFCEANAFEIGERMLRAQIREERRLLTEFTTTVERCYRMLLSEPDTKGALFKAENILREALADQKVGAGATAPEGHNAQGNRRSAGPIGGASGSPTS